VNPTSIAWVATGSFIGSFGALYLKIGSGHLSGNLRSLLTNWRLALGVGLYLLSSVFYVIGVSKGDLSALYPLVSLGSIWTLLWSKLFLGESLTRPKFIAVGLILAGCFLLGLGSRGLSITETHSGTFTQGQTNANYTVTVSNHALTATSGTVAVTEMPPAGLTLVSMEGSGWNCSSASCTRSDSLESSASYPPIAVVVNVASDAPSQVINQVSVSGGGSAGASAADPITIAPRG
jgi:uncharacterized repeat protein (TIGR01451 family)